MKFEIKIIGAGVILIAAGAAAIMRLSQAPVPPSPPPQRVAVSQKPAPKIAPNQPRPIIAPVDVPSLPPAPQEQVIAPYIPPPEPVFTPEPAPAPVAPPPQPPAKTGEFPRAREALALVGFDQEAEDYWVSAINSPSTSADDRQNLIEDLNEDGLSDPKNPTAEDLPVIEYRLRLLEQLAPDAADDVNFAAMQEAHKDLLDMYNSLTQ